MTGPPRARDLALALAFLVGVMLALAVPAHAQPACAFPATVSTAAELGAAIDCFGQQPAGDYLITLDADIGLTASTPAVQNGAGASLVIEGAGHTVDAQGLPQVRPFHVNAPLVTMRNITVAGGNVTDGTGGGGILKTGGKLVIERSTIRDNVHHAQLTAQFSPGGGGGILNRAGMLVVRESTIGDNAALDGDMEGGGGILNYGTLLVEGSTFSGNRLVADLSGPGPEGIGPVNAGGAIFNGLNLSVPQPSPPVTIPIRLKVINSTFVDNSSNTWGGAIANRALNFLLAGESTWFAAAAVSNSTFSGNSAGFPEGGGAIFNRRSGASQNFNSLIWITNSIITNSPSGGDCVGCALGAGNLVGGDAMLGGLQDNGGRTQTLAPLDGSPAVDSGDIAETMFGDVLACFFVNLGQSSISGFPRDGQGDCDHPDVVTEEVLTDQRGDGFLRFAGAAVDVGAVERQVPCPSFPAEVGTASELGSALTCYNASTEPGEHVITLTGDIALTKSTFPVTNTTPGVSLRIDGDGHTVDGQRIDGMRVFSFADDTVAAIENLTVKGGELPRLGSCTHILQRPANCNGGGIWNAGQLTVSDSTITGNKALRGAGVFNAGAYFSNGVEIVTGASLTVRRSSVSANFGQGADFDFGGAGIYNDGGFLKVTDSTITDNTRENPGETVGPGAGINNGPGGTMVIEDSAFHGNGPPAGRGNGGAIANWGEGTVARSVFSENIAEFDGGAVFNAGVLRVFDSTFTGNRARSGGAVSNFGSLRIVGSTVSGNDARPQFGGGIDNLGTLTVINSTLSGNTAGLVGGGIFNRGGLTVVNSTLSGNGAAGDEEEIGIAPGGGILSSRPFTLANTIIANSTAGGDCVATDAVTSNHSLIQDGAHACGLTDGANGNVVGADPLLGPLADNGGPTLTQALGEGSPAIDAGDEALAVDADGEPLETDQRGEGFPRMLGGTVDIGAFEAEADTTAPVVEATVAGTLGENDWYVGDVTVRWTVTDDESEITGTNGCDPVTVNGDTAGETFTCEAMSEGGSASESVTVKRDATGPVVAVTGVEEGAVYTLGSVPEAGCDTQDGTSGVAVAATLTVTGGNPDGTGELTAVCEGAVDNAGNAAEAASVSYTVEAPTYDDLQDLTREHVDNRLLRAGLLGLVATAERLAALGLEEAASRTLDGYVALVQAATPRLIEPEAAAELVALARLLQT